MAKAVKKVDLKKVAKVNVSKAIANSLTEAGFEVLTNFVDFGFTEGTLVVRDKDTDVQVKFIVPKAGLTRYEVEGRRRRCNISSRSRSSCAIAF